eukprot:6488868-Amphidinium_carterae.1
MAKSGESARTSRVSIAAASILSLGVELNISKTTISHFLQAVYGSMKAVLCESKRCMVVFGTTSNTWAAFQ